MPKTEKLLSLQAQKKQLGSVVQLYRTSDSGSGGHGLESHRGHFSNYLKISLLSDCNLLTIAFFVFDQYLLLID